MISELLIIHGISDAFKVLIECVARIVKFMAHLFVFPIIGFFNCMERVSLIVIMANVTLNFILHVLYLEVATLV